MKRLHSILFLLLVIASTAFANGEITFKADAPRTVIANKPFQLTYTVNALGAKDLRAPEISDFEILAGPFESRSSSTQIINGKRTSSTTHTFTYTLMAEKEGTFTIAPASITVKREKYTSNGLKIQVLPPDQEPSTSNQGGQEQAGSNNISDENLFIRTLVSKTNICEQECILVTYKLYTLVDVTQFTNNTKIPDFDGFLKQEIKDDTQQQLAYEHYRERNYGTVVLHQTLLYPQRSGKIKIDPARFEAVVRVQNQAKVRSIFDDFFDSYSNVTKMLIAPSVTINVNPLPDNKPSSFTGGVGKFSISSDITSTKVKANEAVTLRLKIIGKGNIKLVKTPEINFPEGFEVYSPKTTNKFDNTTSGVSGIKNIEYLFIPRIAGTYEIPAVEFSYYDTELKTYKTLSTTPYTLHVEKGDSEAQAPGSVYVSQEDIKELGQDIRYIYNGNIKPKPEGKALFGTLKCWMIFIIPGLLAIILFIILRKIIRENSDLVRSKNKRANHLAQRKLKQAQKHWKKGEKDAFYDEILRALWSYMSDKLSIPVANLTKDKVHEELLKQGVDQEQIDAFMQVLNTCEFARYAPSTSDDPMGELYEQVINVISNLEGTIKK